MQICRRIHSRFSSATEPSPNPGTLTAPSTLQKCGYRILLETCESFWQHFVVGFNTPTETNVCRLDFNPKPLFFFFFSFFCNQNRNPVVFFLCLLSAVSRRDILPSGRSVLCLQGVSERQNEDRSTAQSSSSSSTNSPATSIEHHHLTADGSVSNHQRESLIQYSPEHGLFCASHSYHIVLK